MGSLPWKAYIYILALTALTAGAVLFSIPALGQDAIWWFVVFGVAVAIAALDAFPIHRFGEQVEMTISNAVKFAVVLLFPVPVGVIGTFVGDHLGRITHQASLVQKAVQHCGNDAYMGGYCVALLYLEQSAVELLRLTAKCLCPRIVRRDRVRRQFRPRLFRD